MCLFGTFVLPKNTGRGGGGGRGRRLLSLFLREEDQQQRRKASSSFEETDERDKERAQREHTHVCSLFLCVVHIINIPLSNPFSFRLRVFCCSQKNERHFKLGGEKEARFNTRVPLSLSLFLFDKDAVVLLLEKKRRKKQHQQKTRERH